MHTTTCSWATIISLIRAIVRMLCNWHGDILTRRPKKVKQVHVQEIVTKFFAMIGGIALIAGCAVGDLDWHWIWELDPFNTSASPLYCPTLVNFYKLQLFLPKRHLDFLSGSPGSVWNIGGRPFQSSLSGICEKTNNPKLWKFVPDQLWHKSWNIPPRGIPTVPPTQRQITRCLGAYRMWTTSYGFQVQILCLFFPSESYIVKWKGCKLNCLASVDATMNWNWIFYSPPSLPPTSHPWMNSIALTCTLVLTIGVVFNLSLST